MSSKNLRTPALTECVMKNFNLVDLIGTNQCEESKEKRLLAFSLKPTFQLKLSMLTSDDLCPKAYIVGWKWKKLRIYYDFEFLDLVHTNTN